MKRSTLLVLLVAACSADVTTPEPVADAPVSTEPGQTSAAPADAPELRILTRNELVSSLRWVLGPVTVGETPPELHRAGWQADVESKWLMR